MVTAKLRKAALTTVVWTWLLLCIAAALLLRYWADVWWLGTCLAFGPRWFLLVPAPILAGLAVCSSRRLLWLIGAASLLVLGPIMQPTLPKIFSPPVAGAKLRILTCNVKGHSDGNVSLEKQIRTSNADIVALQGYWGKTQIEWPVHWQTHQVGELLIASRFPIRSPVSYESHDPPSPWPHLRALSLTVDAPQGALQFVSVHLLSPREGFDRLHAGSPFVPGDGREAFEVEMQHRARISREVRAWIKTLAPAAEPVIVAGDFNLPVDSQIYAVDWSTFQNAFSSAGWGYGWTEWTALRGIGFGVRIDHILWEAGWHARQCWVGGDVGSDHRPVIAELEYVTL